MGNIGDTFTPSAPPVVGTAGPDYATTIDAILTEAIARLSVKVPLSSLNLNAGFSLGGNPLTDAGYVTLANTSSTPGASPVNRLTAFGGDFYYVSPSGAIQITSGGLLNAAAVGGITGAYGGANPAQFRFDNVANRYDAYGNFGTSNWAYIRALGFDVAGGATSSAFARIQYAGVSNVTFTLPTVVASVSDRPLFIDNTGQIKVGYGAKELPQSPYVYVVSAGASTDIGVSSPSQVGIETKTVNQPTVLIPVYGLTVGQQITSAVIRLNKTSATATTLALVRLDSTGTLTTVFSTSTSTNGSQTVTLTGAAHTVATTNNYHIRWAPAASTQESFANLAIFVSQSS